MTTALLAAGVLQLADRLADIGPELIDEYWPLVKRLGWFLGVALLVTVPGWYLLVPSVSRIVRHRNRNNPTLEQAIARHLRLIVVVFGIAVGAAVAGFTGFLTDSAIVIAAATLALGVAAQSVVGSFVSGTVLVADPEFNVGDYVKWADGEGTIRSITLRVTRVQTPDGELVTIPNDVLTKQEITRPFGHGHFQVVQYVSLSYDDDLEAALAGLETAAEGLEQSLDAPSPQVYVDEFGGDAIVARVHYWIDEPDRREVFAARSTFARSAKQRLEAAGLTIAPAAKRNLQGAIEVADAA
ncbi:MscS Mechanosensitive ion channel [Salinarchaeum sp. Harcht-Bsk1]|uniref:mechanosensitive ion channel family protein n=1 Tax=Salinarchaeum sp. Harcht-Bsk1 TaxID=1333523 RepID=UPI0003423655|nr:mechanosensitive ion channel family protein [Salinarchaeum sp. Harcht-Bsk1]AGN02074.1 MscS Mechanosensitive ion channel [Salinarchaeum sp. Harcht-Bsk1]